MVESFKVLCFIVTHGFDAAAVNQNAFLKLAEEALMHVTRSVITKAVWQFVRQDFSFKRSLNCWQIQCAVKNKDVGDSGFWGWLGFPP